MAETRIGYARVSTHDQNLDLQREALNKDGCARIYTDQISGSARERPGLTQALDYARAGDTLVVWKLDRFGRSIQHLIELACDLEKRDVNPRSINDNIDTKIAAGRFFSTSWRGSYPGQTRLHGLGGVPTNSGVHVIDAHRRIGYRDSIFQGRGRQCHWALFIMTLGALDEFNPLPGFESNSISNIHWHCDLSHRTPGGWTHIADSAYYLLFV